MSDILVAGAPAEIIVSTETLVQSFPQDPKPGLMRIAPPITEWTVAPDPKAELIAAAIGLENLKEVIPPTESELPSSDKKVTTYQSIKEIIKKYEYMDGNSAVINKDMGIYTATALFGKDAVDEYLASLGH